MTMTGNTTTSVVYEPDGMQTRFPVPFPVFHADDVYAIAVDGARQTPLTNYTVEGVGGGEGVHVKFFTPPDFGPKLVLYRWTKRVQESDYPEGGRFPAKVVETDFDRLVGMAQEIDDQFEWTLKIPRGADVTPEEYTESLLLASEEAKAAAEESVSSARESVAAALDAREMALDAASQANNAALMAESAAQSALDAANTVSQGVPDGSEERKGLIRLATAEEHRDGAAGVAATPEHILPMLASLREDIGGQVVEVVETSMRYFSIRAGMRVSLPGDVLYPNCAWPEGQLVLFEEWPDLEEEFNAGFINALSPVATAAEIDGNPGLFVQHEGGLYLPKLGGLFARNWTPAQTLDAGRLAGSKQGYAQRNASGHISHHGGGTVTGASGSFYVGSWLGYVPRTDTSNGGYNVAYMDGSRQYPVAAEVRPDNLAAPVAIYLGRHITEVR